MSTKSKDSLPLRNPFLEALSLKPVTKYTEWSVTKGGEVPTGTPIQVPRLVDYSNGSWYGSMPFSDLHQFSKPALKVFGYLLMHLKWGQDYLELKYLTKFDPTQPNKLVMSKSPFYVGIKELTARNIIRVRESREGTYWINPAMFFKGNRLTSFPNNLK